jgi:serine/threonine protein kinase
MAIICSECAHTNIGITGHCEVCRSELTVLCPVCGHTNSNNNEFCDMCVIEMHPKALTLTRDNLFYTNHLPPSTLLKQGKYKIEKVLDKGSFGITYRGVDLSNLRKVTIKELLPHYSSRSKEGIVDWRTLEGGKEKLSKKFTVKAELLSQVNHPNVMKFDWFEENNTAYVVELTIGESIDSILSNGIIFHEYIVRDYLLQLADALKAIHKRGLCHQNINPENIILSHDNKPILIYLINNDTSFDYFKTLREQENRLPRSYTPETQQRSEQSFDIFSLCTSAYRMLIGPIRLLSIDIANAPVAFDSNSQILSNKLTSLSSQMENVLLKGLNLKLEERFQSTQELIDALQEIQEDSQMDCPVCFAANPDNALICSTCGSSLTSDNSFHFQLLPFHLPINTLLRQCRYRIEETLDEGSFGITYRGIDLITSKGVAIKELLPDRSSRKGITFTWSPSVTQQAKQELLQRFTTEAELLSQINHPNIMQFDWFEENNTAYVVELTIGESMSSILNKENVLDESIVRVYLLQLADALGAIHSKGLFHRNINPETIILSQDNRPILTYLSNDIEFNISPDFMDDILTFEYASLEKWSSSAKFTQSSDIFSLCGSAYKMLTGQTPSIAIDRVVSAPDPLVLPSRLISLSPQMEKILLKGLNLKDKERFQAAQELIDALLEIQEE